MRRMRRVKNLLLVMLSAAALSTPPGTPAPVWAATPMRGGTPAPAAPAGEPFLLRTTARGDEFSILMPSQPAAVVSRLDFSFAPGGQVVDEERVFSAYAGGAVFLVEVLVTSDGRKVLDEMLASRARGGRARPDVISLGGHEGRQEEVYGKSFGYEESFYRKIQYFATRRNVYVVSAAAREEGHPAIDEYFSSLKLGAMVSGDAEAKGTRPSGQPAAARAAAPAAAEAGQVFKPEEVSRKAVVVWQHDPNVYEEVGRLNGPIFKMKIQVVLAAGGEVTDVKILKGLTQAINEKVVTSVKYMKFIPAEREGRPVSQWHTVEYAFGR